VKKQNNTRTDWPATELRLLLKACVCPEEEARSSWREWLATRSIDNATWAEVRLLAALAGRIGLIDPQSPARALLEGICRFVWTRNQARLDNSIIVFDLLNKSGIPVMLLKGMARIATNPAFASTRYVRDIDIIVEASHIDETCDVLISNGWRPVYGSLPGDSRAEPFGRLLPEKIDSTTVTQEDFHVDIHRSAIHYGRSGTFDDVLWTRCRDAELRGRPVKVPSETDQFLHSIAHSTVSDIDRPADWVIDALDAAKGNGFSWEVCASELLKRHMGAAITSGLEFLESELGLIVPGFIKDIIKRDRRNLFYSTEVAVYRQIPKDRTSFGNKCMRWAEWLRSRHCLYHPSEQRVTLWEGRKLRLAERKNAAKRRIPFLTPIADYKLHSTDLSIGHQFIIDIKIAGGTDPIIRFDLMLNGIWLGRLRIKLSQPSENKILARRFHITLPRKLNGDAEVRILRLILLNLKGRVPVVMPFRVDVGLSPVGQPVIPHCSITVEQAFPNPPDNINSGQEVYPLKTAINSGMNVDKTFLK
jgi:hypothetical protein